MAAEGVKSLLFLPSQIQKQHSVEDLLNSLIVFLIRVLLKPSFFKQHKTDVAPSSTAKSSTHQPLDSMIVLKAKYILILVLCQDFTFSSQGCVSSLGITLLKLFEKIVMSCLSWVKVMWTGKQLLLRPSKRTQSDVGCIVPTGGVLLPDTFAPFFHKCYRWLSRNSYCFFLFEMKVLRASLTWPKSECISSLK